MKLVQWGYTKRRNIKAIFNYCPHSNVIFRQIKDYYFVYIVNWSELDPPVTKKELNQMEISLNQEMGTLGAYEKRKSNQHQLLT